MENETRTAVCRAISELDQAKHELTIGLVDEDINEEEEKEIAGIMDDIDDKKKKLLDYLC